MNSISTINFADPELFKNGNYPHAAHDMQMFAWNYGNHPNARTLIPRHQRRLHEWYFDCEAHAAELRASIDRGEIRTLNDWGGGWSWSADVITTSDGQTFRIFGNGSCCPYGGQHDKPVYKL